MSTSLQSVRSCAYVQSREWTHSKTHDSRKMQLRPSCKASQQVPILRPHCNRLSTLGNEEWEHFLLVVGHQNSSRLQAFHKSPRESKTKRSVKKVRACVTDKQTEQQEAAGASVALEPLEVLVKEGRRPDELRAAAVLRSNSFNVYPTGRSEAAAKAHRDMKAQAEFECVTLKVSGQDPSFGRVACLYAGVADSIDTLDPNTKICNREGNWWVVGTLDLNQGQRLPGEDLVGDFPQGSDAGERRAYLSNVCVETAVRRRGVARKLIEEAKAVARSWGIEDLYVHVLAENHSARKLYEQMGFAYEKEETPQTARYLGRPKRLLLRIQLVNG